MWSARFSVATLSLFTAIGILSGFVAGVGVFIGGFVINDIFWVLHLL